MLCAPQALDKRQLKENVASSKGKHRQHSMGSNALLERMADGVAHGVRGAWPGVAAAAASALPTHCSLLQPGRVVDEHSN